MLKTTGKILLLLCVFLIAGCSSPAATTAIPTPDLNPIRTEVAATVLAQVPQLCALTPTITTIPSPTETATLIPTIPPASSSTPVADTGTGTPDANDLAMWVSQSIQDDTVFAPGQKFTMTWTMKNVGTSTWTAGYLLRFYSGTALGAPKEIPLGQEVLPGQTVDITVEMEAPLIPAEYRSDWVLSNEARRNFKEPVFLKIKVEKTSTQTPTATATATPTVPTATPTATSTP